jgi:hypothetical protein
MRKDFFLFFWLMMAGVVLLTACKKDNDDPARQAEVDEQIILDYIATNNIDAQRHESGLYYLITKEGTGEHPAVSSKIEIFYSKGVLRTKDILPMAAFSIKLRMDRWCFHYKIW